jgi:hypothetical protein
MPCWIVTYIHKQSGLAILLPSSVLRHAFWFPQYYADFDFDATPGILEMVFLSRKKWHQSTSQPPELCSTLQITHIGYSFQVSLTLLKREKGISKMAMEARTSRKTPQNDQVSCEFWTNRTTLSKLRWSDFVTIFNEPLGHFEKQFLTCLYPFSSGWCHFLFLPKFHSLRMRNQSDLHMGC